MAARISSRAPSHRGPACRLTACIAACIVTCASLGCGTAALVESAPTIRIVWPPPPAEGRVEFDRIVKGNGGLPSARSRLARAILGTRRIDLARPFGVAADASGRIAVADTDGPAVVVYDFPGQRFIYVEEFGKQALASPIGVAPGPGASFYVTDSVLRKVLLFDQDGRFVHEFAAGTLIERPTGIAVEKGTGRVLVVDSLGGTVFVFSPGGKLLRTMGGGKLYRPTDVACDAEGRAFVVDAMNFRVQIYGISGGKSLGTFGVLGDGSGTLRDPRGVAVDPQGNVHVVDRAFSRVQVFDAEGRFLLAYGEPGAGPGQFDMPSDIFIDEKGVVYVSDSFNGRIQVFRLTGGSE
ncbi:MAG: 6-bladed beta-propeller, partial [Planctomycetota bacterium]